MPGIVDRSEHFDHTADRLHIALRLLQNFDDDDLPWLGRQRCAGRHQNVVRNALVLRHDDRDTALVQQTADELVGAALDDFDDLAFGPAAPVGAGDARQHTIAVQHLGHLVFGQHEIGAAIVADQKAEAVAMALHLAGQQIGARRNEQQSRAIADDTARALEFFDFSIERFVIVAQGQVARQGRAAAAACAPRSVLPGLHRYSCDLFFCSQFLSVAAIMRPLSTYFI